MQITYKSAFLQINNVINIWDTYHDVLNVAVFEFWHHP